MVILYLAAYTIVIAAVILVTAYVAFKFGQDKVDDVKHTIHKAKKTVTPKTKGSVYVPTDEEQWRQEEKKKQRDMYEADLVSKGYDLE